MPQAAHNPHKARNGQMGSNFIAARALKSPVKIPLNDDAQEKAKRLHSRHALNDMQKKQIRAAVSPMRKHTNSPSFNTPRRISRMEEDLEGGLTTVSGTTFTPLKRVPILAHFEEWIRMASDNKINTTNSWNFALIDYFYDMSLLKEGDGIDFQRASYTLDGCVKIYTNRVDSIATETGKLLSGLAYSRNNKTKGESGEEQGSEEMEDEDGDVRKKPAKRRPEKRAPWTLHHTQALPQIGTHVSDT